MVKVMVPQFLDMADTLTIQQFFWKAWHYMDAYWCVYLSYLFIHYLKVI